MVELPNRSTVAGPVVAGLGGAAAVLQALLAWQQDNVPAALRSPAVPDTTYIGSHYVAGEAIAVLGATILVLCVEWVRRDRFEYAPWWILGVGIVTIAISTLSYVSIANDLATMGADVASTGAVLLDSVGLGLYVAFAGGALATIGALTGLLARKVPGRV